MSKRLMHAVNKHLWGRGRYESLMHAVNKGSWEGGVYTKPSSSMPTIALDRTREVYGCLVTPSISLRSAFKKSCFRHPENSPPSN